MTTSTLPVPATAAPKKARIGHIGPNGWSLFGDPESTFIERLKRGVSWFTTIQDGSLSDQFRLSGTDSSSQHGQSETTGTTKHVVSDAADSYLDAIIVENETPSMREKAKGNSKTASDAGNSTTGTPHHQYHHGGTYDENSFYVGGTSSFMRWKAWPAIVEFFEPRMLDQKAEDDYQIMFWHSSKMLTFVASIYLVLNWVLYLALNRSSTQTSIYAQVMFYGPFTLLTLPLPFMVGADMYRTRPVFFQIWLAAATWFCAYAEVIQMKECHFFDPLRNDCASKDFLAMNYYATGLPALLMFICSKRIYNAVAQLVFFILVCALLLPDQDIYTRNAISVLVFYVFMQYLSWSIEASRRQMFLLAVQLKFAFRAKHKAQIAESRSAFTKRRFANYIFHEVRVPLNNASLAFQLLQAGQAFKPEYSASTEVHALNHGLTLMSTVLNDVLDFEKMNSGHFENHMRPFPLHSAISTMLDLVGVQTNSRHAQLIRNLDAAIDQVRAPSRYSEGLWVVGSKLRLQQIITNLATNAFKYTPDNIGRVEITTKLICVTPEDELPPDPPELEGDDSEATMRDEKIPNGSNNSKKRREVVTIMLEIKDNGPGIKPSDLVEHRLFQPFIQTSVGKSSGTGTGLGLAIVKQIVKRSGGRLGIQSSRGEGATFWVELSYLIATPEEVENYKQADVLPPHPPTYFAGTSPRPEQDDEPSITPPPPPADSIPLISPPLPTASQRPNFLDKPSTQSAAPSIPPDGPLRALVCDDDQITRELCKRMLTKLGCVVDTAADGQECLDIVLKTPQHPPTYDLICLDNFMPVLTGEEAIRELRSLDREEYVVGCTGNALTEDQASYREAGVDDVLPKPILIADFKRIIQTAKARRAQRLLPDPGTLRENPEPTEQP